MIEKYGTPKLRYLAYSLQWLKFCLKISLRIFDLDDDNIGQEKWCNY